MCERDVPFPYEFEELKPEDKQKLVNTLGDVADYVAVGPKKYKVKRPFCEEASNIYNMPVREDDIAVVTYQRSGTTWTQELVWLLANNFDYDKAASVLITQRYTFLDLFMFFAKEWKESFLANTENKVAAQAIFDNLASPVVNKLLSTPSPRFIKSHLPMSLLPHSLLDTGKVVYVARDPRDVAVSSYHHTRLFEIIGTPKSFKDFWNLFMHDLFTLTPIFEHVKEAWELRHHPNMLFLFYEEMSKDLPATIRRVGNFLGKEVTEEQMSRLCDHLSIKNFKNNHSVNYEQLRQFGMLRNNETFIRKGKTGGWRDYFDEQMEKQAEQWIADNLRDTDLRYPHL